MTELTTAHDLVPLIQRCALIGVDGWDGVGKSHLSAALSELLDADCISLDDFVERNQHRYVEAVRFDRLEEHLASTSRPLILEGVCLKAVLDRLSVTADAIVYVKLYSKHGDWRHAKECDVTMDVNDVLAYFEAEANAFARILGGTPAGLSGYREEVIRYHHQYQPWEGAVVFRRTEDG